MVCVAWFLGVGVAVGIMENSSKSRAKIAVKALGWRRRNDANA